MSGKLFNTDMTIRFEHCDTAGIVYYPRFFLMLALVIERWFDEIGCDYWHLHMERGEGIPAVHTECDFFQPSRLGEVLEFTLSVERLGSKSFSLAISARGRGEDQVRLSARMVLVWSRINPGPAGRLIPEKYRGSIGEYLVSQVKEGD
jgi:4-hydroxybenzoyl-CoA thioesterase